MRRVVAGCVALAVVAAGGCGRRDRGPSEDAGPTSPPTAGSASAGVAPSGSAPTAAAPPTPDRGSTAAPTPCPEGMALVGDALCIDRWEATLVNEDGSDHSPYHAPGPKKVRAVSRPSVVPQAYISTGEAELACRRAEKDLCTTQQWVRACQGLQPPKRAFPYGPKEKKGACNTQRREHPMTRLTGGEHRTDSLSLNSPRLNQLSDTVARTGEHAECVTPDGVFDLHGNLLEWTRSTYVRPLAMGGYYLDGKKHGVGCEYVTSAHGPEYHDFSTGFRCCKKPDPAAVAAQRAAERGEPAPPPRPEPGEARDPPGMRGFANERGKLPKLEPPAYEPPDARCPVDMVHVTGLRCAEPVQFCKEWLPRLSVGEKIACKEFAAPSKCESGKRPMSYCIDRYELTPKGYEYPITHVNWTEAELLCQSMDKRLCQEDEWEFACEGPDALPYPYGYVRDGRRCNHDFPEHELVTAPDVFIDRRAKRDALPQCQSPFGVFNLVGNVDEWTTRTASPKGKRAILRGGWWLIGRNRCRAATANHGEIYAGVQTGVRCCKAARAAAK